MLMQGTFGSQWYFWKLQFVCLILLDFFLNAVHTFEVEIIFTLLHEIFCQSIRLIKVITVKLH